MAKSATAGPAELGSDNPEMNAGALYCTTRSQNAHRTDERELLYPWHPWAGRQVYVHEVVEKASQAAFRCSLTGIASDRWLEIPAWMFDRATSKSWHLRSAPVASIATLASLAAVLNDAVAARDRSSELRDSGAASNSLSVIPGDARATSIDTPATRPLRSALRRRIASNAAMAEPARRGAADADHVDDPPDPRPRRRRGQAAEGGGT